MHTLIEAISGLNGGSHVPAFLVKLWKIVDDPQTNDLIAWSDNGSSFIIKNQSKFSRELLPLYYKHNNMASFIRQLNMYGFHKVISVEQGGLKVEKDEMEFAHPFFIRGQEGSLELIKRKMPNNRQDDIPNAESLNKVLVDVRTMKGRQDNLDGKLITIKRENEALWRELSTLRAKHAKQQQIVTKLLQFLINMLTPQTHRLGYKRRMPLMLNDSDGPKAKIIRSKDKIANGPVFIHDVTELLDSDSREALLLDDEIGRVNEPISNAGSPVSSTGEKSPYHHHQTNPGERMTIQNQDDHPDLLITVDPNSINPINHVKIKKEAVAKKSNIGNGTKNMKIKKMTNDVTEDVNDMSNLITVPQTINGNIVVENMNGNGNYLESLLSSLVDKNQSKAQSPAAFVSSEVNSPSMSNYNTETEDSNNVILGEEEPLEVILANFPTTLSTTLSSENQEEGRINADDSQTPSTSATISKELNRIPLEKNQVETASATSTNSNPIVKVVRKNYSNNFDEHLGEVENGLYNLKELMKNDYSFSLDANALLGIFGDDFASLNMEQNNPSFDEGLLDNIGQNVTNSQGELLSGQELVAYNPAIDQYNPSLFELADEDTEIFSNDQKEDEDLQLFKE